tara:strand:+ start:41 stop:1186 length:1146 start_codon:yes stop_codon:yes gene_type:complete
MKMNEYFLTCPRGLEEVTSADIAQYLESSPIADKGGVSFKGNEKDMYTINLYSRTGMHLLKKIHFFNSSGYENLYKSIFKMPWSKIVGKDKTFSIRSKIKSDIFSHSNFTTLKIKDAIVDSIKKDLGSRPSIDRYNPDIKIFAIINNNSIKIYMDSSGRPLFMRGYRTKIHKAALNESMAAGLVLLSNWDRKSAFYDIMCGSGTIPIEACLIANNIPPRILRDDYAFHKWDDFDESLWNILKEKSIKGINMNKNLVIYGSDLVKKNLELCIESLSKLKLDDKIIFKWMDFNNFEPLEKNGVIIVNPPYGERIGEQFNLEEVYKLLGDKFKKNCSGHDVYVFTGNASLAKKIGLRTKRRIILKNGTIDCRLLYYPMREGSFK